MKKYNTVIFDMDGTLLDTLEDITDGVNYSLGLYGFPSKSSQEVRRSTGNGALRLMEQSIPGGLNNTDFDKALDAYLGYYIKNNGAKTKPYPDISKLLSELHDQGFKMAIVSNKIDSEVKKLNRKYFNDLVQVAIGETETIKRKPAPDSLYQAMSELGSVKAETVFIGDSEVDIATAKNAGVDCIAVTWGFRDKESLLKNGAVKIVNEPLDILELV